MDVVNVKLKISQEAFFAAIKDTVIVCCRNWIQCDHLLTLTGELRIGFDEEQALVVPFNEKVSNAESSLSSAEIGIAATSDSIVSSESLLKPIFFVEDNDNSDLSVSY